MSMYLSRVELQADRRETLLALSQPQLMHGAIERSFTGGRARRLWRLDWLDERCYLLVLSGERPDFTALFKQFCKPDATPAWETKDYEPLLARLQNAQKWRFRLKANPVHNVGDKDDPAKHGKVTAHVTQEQQKQWLLSRAQTLGVVFEPDTVDVTHTQWYKFDKGGGRPITLRAASFEGVLTVADVDRFREVLQAGVGRAKAYGCGLMTVMRCGGGTDG
jgi:CRISPR system Cascade subunit CasE